jgi:hypothetical protein
MSGYGIGSRTDKTTTACFKEIDECDLFIGIYAWRYGWQPSPKSPSITEQEFDHARDKGKRCLCYLVDQNYSWPPAFLDRGTPARRLERFKRRVKTFPLQYFQ